MKILFISGYTEILKTFIPLIKHFKTYNFYVIAKYTPSSSDYENSKNLLNNNKLKGCLIEDEEVKIRNSKSYKFI